jgi:hypothetical protein
MDPNHFGTVNRGRQITLMSVIGRACRLDPDRNELAGGRVASSIGTGVSRAPECAARGNQRFVDSRRRFGLYNAG